MQSTELIKAAGSATFLKGWLKEAPKLKTSRALGKSTWLRPWLKSSVFSWAAEPLFLHDYQPTRLWERAALPLRLCCFSRRDALPNDRDIRLGTDSKDTSSRLWLKEAPNVSCWSDLGKATCFKPGRWHPLAIMACWKIPQLSDFPISPDGHLPWISKLAMLDRRMVYGPGKTCGIICQCLANLWDNLSFWGIIYTPWNPKMAAEFGNVMFGTPLNCGSVSNLGGVSMWRWVNIEDRDDLGTLQMTRSFASSLRYWAPKCCGKPKINREIREISWNVGVNKQLNMITGFV